MIKLKCRRIRSLLALWVGNDLDEGQQFIARRHLVECPPCRDYWHELQGTQKVLESSRVPADEQTSMWPEIRARLAMPQATAAASRVHGWWPAAALAAACLLVWFAASSSPAFAPYGLAGQRVFDGPVAAPLTREDATVLANEPLQGAGQARSSSSANRPPAVPVSDTRIWSF